MHYVQYSDESGIRVSSIQMVTVIEKYLDSHLHLGLLEREIKTSDLCVLDTSGHLLSGDGAVKSVTVDLRIEQNETA